MTATSPLRPLVPRWVIAVLSVALVGYLIYLLRGVLAPVFLALLIAYLLDPVVDRLVAWRIPRWIAIFVLLGAFLLVVLLVALLVVPRAVREATDFFDRLPVLLERTWQRIEPWLVEQGVVVPHTLTELYSQLGANAGAVSDRAAKGLTSVFQWVANNTANVVGAVVNAIIVPVLAFYFLYDWDRIVETAADLIPPRWRTLAGDIAKDIDGVVAQFVRGQLVVMTLLAVAYSVGYAVLGVPLAVPIGILAGVVSFVPHVGSAIALGTALLACTLAGPTWLQLGLVVVVHFGIQTFEGFVITPRIMSDRVGLSAAWIILAMVGFGELFGVFGVLIAVPAAAVIKTLVVRLVAVYKASEAYQGAPPPSLAAAVEALQHGENGETLQNGEAVQNSEVWSGPGRSTPTE